MSPSPDQMECAMWERVHPRYKYTILYHTLHILHILYFTILYILYTIYMILTIYMMSPSPDQMEWAMWEKVHPHFICSTFEYIFIFLSHCKIFRIFYLISDISFDLISHILFLLLILTQICQIWPNIRQIWSSGVSLQRSCNLQLRRIGLREG